VTTDDDLLVAAGPSVDPGCWLGILDELMTRAGARFRRVEPRRRARAFVQGLLAGLPRKNCWTIAEHAGDRSPGGMQHLLGRLKTAVASGALRPRLKRSARVSGLLPCRTHTRRSRAIGAARVTRR
jgi:hypothetical protein